LPTKHTSIISKEKECAVINNKQPHFIRQPYSYEAED
jgi:hypothetical protein